MQVASSVFTHHRPVQPGFCNVARHQNMLIQDGGAEQLEQKTHICMHMHMHMHMHMYMYMYTYTCM